MPVNNLFLNMDHNGKRRPTALTWGLIGLLVFGSYFLPKHKKPVKTKFKETIIKKQDLTTVAENTLPHEGKAFKFDYSKIFKPPESNITVPLPVPPSPAERRISPINTKIIVFDNTNTYQSSFVVPLGSMVKCLLIHNIVTNNFEAPVIAQVWEDFYFDGKLLLPFGTRIYGTASAGKQRDRVTVQFHDVVFQDGRTVKIDAMGLSKDGSGGLTGTVIDESNKKTFIAMALNFLTGTVLGLQQTATNQVTGLNQIEASSRNALLNGAASTFQGEAQRIKADTELSKGYAIVLAGSPLVVYFQKEADI